MNLDTNVAGLPRIRIIRHAADMLGSEKALANLLRVTPEEMRKWLSGEKAPADGTLFVVLAILHGAQQSKKRARSGPFFTLLD
jgi:DNA-binding transcriptional regulator YiaG